jgi:cobyrinic acid a,c-diamide synthase
MYLGEVLETEGTEYPMCGVLALGTRIPAGLTLAYVQVTTRGGLFGPNHEARGHMFHHSELDRAPAIENCYEVRTSRGEQLSEGYRTRNVLASYAHLHFRSDPSLADSFVQRCADHARGAAPAGQASS